MIAINNVAINPSVRVERSFTDFRVQSTNRAVWLGETLQSIGEKANYEGWSGADSRSVQRDALRITGNLLLGLPTSLPLPEIGADSEGEVTLDWVSSSNQHLTLSIDMHGRILFAGRVGTERITPGEIRYTQGFPYPIEALLVRMFTSPYIRL